MSTRTLNVQITGDSRSLNRVLDSTESRTKKWGIGMAKSFAVVGAAAAGGLAVGLKKSADAAIEAEKAQATMTAQLKASGVSYKKHREEIDKVIQSHSKLSGFDDEDLQKSFTNIVRVTGDVDKSLRLTGLAADFARAKNMDVAKAGELVGKVAGGNTGILGRYGIKIKEGATAQEALAVLQTKFAGQAEAYGKTTAGAMDRASVASENLGEIVGAKLTPLLAKGATALVDLVDQAGKLGGPIREATGKVADAFQVVRKAVERFRERNKEAIDDIIKAGRNLARAFQFVFEEIIAPVVRTAIRRIVPVLEGLKDTIAGLIRFVSSILTGQWGKAWDAAKDTVSAALRTIRNLIVGAADILWTAVKSLGGVIIKGLVAGLKGLGTAIKNAVIDGVKAGVNAAKGAIGNVLSFLNPFGDGIGRLSKQIGDGVGSSLKSPGASLMGADQDLYPFAAAASRAGLRTTSGIRPGAITSSGNQSYHSSGDAIDVAGSPGAMLGFFQTMKRTAGSRLRELIYTPGGAGIKDGHSFRYSGQVAADHFDHVHVAYTGPFGDGIGQAVQAARAAGFRGQDLVTAVAIAGGESGWRNSARLQSGVEDSRGMWQINTMAHPWASNLGNADANAKAAYKVFKQAGGFGPWSVYTSGKYRSFLSRARAAVSGGGSSSGGGGGGGPKPAPRSGPNASLGYEGNLARTSVTEATARAKDNLPLLVFALQGELTLKKRRLKRIRKLLKGRRTKASRKALLAEQASLIGEIAELQGELREFSADMMGGAGSISQAEAMDAGVSPDTGAGADTGGGGGAGGETTADPNIAILADLTAQMVANQNRLIRLTEVQGPQILAAVIAAVNGSIGGSLGLGGFQSVGVPGQLARY